MTLRAENLSKKILENNGKKPMGKIMKEAGYKDGYAKNPKLWFQTKTGKELLERLREERDEALKEMKKKRGTAKYADLTNSVEKLTKVIQLLSGGATDRQETLTSEKVDENIKKLSKEFIAFVKEKI